MDHNGVMDLWWWTAKWTTSMEQWWWWSRWIKRRAAKDLWSWTERRIEDFGALVLARPPDPTRCRCFSETEECLHKEHTSNVKSCKGKIKWASQEKNRIGYTCYSDVGLEILPKAQQTQGIKYFDSFNTFTESQKAKTFRIAKIFVAKTFRMKRVNRVNFQIGDKCA